MRTQERVAWFVVVVLLALCLGTRRAWMRDRARWRATVAAAAVSPVVIVKQADDGTTIELWKGLPDAEPSRLVSELEPRDGLIYRDLADALNGVE